MSFIVPIFAWNISLVSPVFLRRSLVFPILLFSSIYLHWSLRKAFLSLLAILWNSAFRGLYLSFSPLLFTSLLFTAICKASPDCHFAFLHLFSMEMVLIPVFCTMSWTSVHSSSGTLSNRSSLLNLFLTSTGLYWVVNKRAREESCRCDVKNHFQRLFSYIDVNFFSVIVKVTVLAMWKNNIFNCVLYFTLHW